MLVMTFIVCISEETVSMGNTTYFAEESQTGNVYDNTVDDRTASPLTENAEVSLPIKYTENDISLLSIKQNAPKLM